MSDDNSSFLAWSAGIAAGVVGLATLGYVLGPVGKPEKPPNQKGPQMGGAGGPPGAGGLSQEDLLRLLIQQQQMQQQQKAQQQQQKQVEDQQMQQMQQQLLQQQLQKQQMQNILGQQPSRPNALGPPTPALTPSPLASAPSPLDLQVPSPKDRFRQGLVCCLTLINFNFHRTLTETSWLTKNLTPLKRFWRLWAKNWTETATGWLRALNALESTMAFKSGRGASTCPSTPENSFF
jgi:hypothetical protein